MPVLLPTPAELRRMTPAQRGRARRALWAILTETDRQVDRDQRKLDDAASYGEYVRATARELAKYEPIESAYVIEQRRQIALEATK